MLHNPHYIRPHPIPKTSPDHDGKKAAFSILSTLDAVFICEVSRRLKVRTQQITHKTTDVAVWFLMLKILKLASWGSDEVNVSDLSICWETF